MRSTDIIHLPVIGMSIAVDTNNDGIAKIAFTFCNQRDVFKRKISNDILHGRIKKGDTINIEYKGDTPRRDVLFPLADFVREYLGFFWDEEFKTWVHPGVYGVPSEDLISEMEIIEPATRVYRSVSKLERAIREFVFELESSIVDQPLTHA